jgi:hypothetical protein
VVSKILLKNSHSFWELSTVFGNLFQSYLGVNPAFFQARMVLATHYTVEFENNRGKPAKSIYKMHEKNE